MRIPLAILLAASLAVSATPAAAQETNAANSAETTAPAPGADANMIAVPPADANMAVTTTDVAPAEPVTMAEEPVAAPRAAPARGFPWGLIGLVGLVGLLGRRRSN